MKHSNFTEEQMIAVVREQEAGSSTADVSGTAPRMASAPPKKPTGPRASQ